MTSLSDVERARALERFRALRPFLEQDVPLAQVANREGIDVRTAQRWVKRYRTHGLPGLARKGRDDKERRRLLPAFQELIEGLALQKPRLSVAAIYRQVGT